MSANLSVSRVLAVGPNGAQYIDQARRAARAAHDEERDRRAAQTGHQVAMSIMAGVAWGAAAPFVWATVAPLSAIFLLVPPLLIALILGR